ncbi:acriflavin resistance protein, partial [Vibrio parahaemolyticus]
QATYLKDVARLELGADNYSLRSLLNGQNAVGLQIVMSPGANALEVAESVRETMARLQANFIEGIDYKIAYDPTIFVSASLKSVAITLLEATILVVLVVVLFLQSWRASIIPLVAVPVS